MRDELNFYIDGEWVESNSSETIEVVNPASEEIIGHVSAGSKQDINSAVIAANEAFKSFSQISKNER